ncbi:MAG: phytanoyl-CoA dioxygenase family protein [Candidatus Thiodiazotropha sp. (ex Myrtea spinifera)]|nr:phytanoyl-CoA dioxygenase family protein [Candidatus Thiodiazotropha sp. (ex Myrtea spinifera)]MCU7829461.1 phytanoyl-CoA dioxygenase family protein [Candidatus Thiodiazotropha sp. (ex Myrtea sp. 'scaly one' KF741663)]
MKSEYEKNGYHLVKGAIDEIEVNSLIQELSIFENETNNYGVRDLMNKVPAIRKLAISAPLLTIAKEVLGEAAKPVRSVFFDKVPTANWNVAWHQDTSIAVKEEADIPGFGPWSEKQGITHVEPPEDYLAQTLTLRIHLDNANTESGVLRVVPGTHRDGRITSRELIEIVEKSEAEILECSSNTGDVLLMCPLLFHSSRKATKPSHRRIIHIEYSAKTLPNPLVWYESKG